MSEMIERVAMAIDPFAWSQEHGMQVRRENSLMQAHDAIEAMRVPTATMQIVVSANWGRRTWSEYNDVINAALKVQP